jgi:hypothetical protein
MPAYNLAVILSPTQYIPFKRNALHWKDWGIWALTENGNAPVTFGYFKNWLQPRYPTLHPIMVGVFIRRRQDCNV